jgi:hypothetical protein
MRGFKYWELIGGDRAKEKGSITQKAAWTLAGKLK